MTSCLTARPDPVSPTQLQALFREHGFRPRRSLGQTFLVDANIVRKIIAAADLSPEHSVLEIGPGAGAVTQALVGAAGRVVAIEVDPVLVEVLRETVGEAAEVICGDVLEAPLDKVLSGRRAPFWTVVANLPYSITGPAIVRLLEARRWVRSLVVMVQLEVAERLLTAPGSRQRGWLTVLAEVCCEMKLAARVSRNCFWPRPQVDSAILAMQVRRPALVSAQRERLLRDLLKAAFSTRRKTILNALSHAYRESLPGQGMSREAVRAALEQCAIRPDLRAEDLSSAQFLSLTEAVSASREGPAS